LFTILNNSPFCVLLFWRLKHASHFIFACLGIVSFFHYRAGFPNSSCPGRKGFPPTPPHFTTGLPPHTSPSRPPFRHLKSESCYLWRGLFAHGLPSVDTVCRPLGLSRLPPFCIHRKKFFARELCVFFRTLMSTDFALRFYITVGLFWIIAFQVFNGLFLFVSRQ